MKQKHHSTEEIIRILRQPDTDQTIESVCREHNLSKENAELKKMLAEAMLKNRVLEEVNSKKW